MAKTYKFSFDDEDDAINSLALFYNINSVEIYKKLPEINVLVKEKIDSFSNDVGLYVYYISCLLKVNNYQNSEIEKLQVSYYHHCASDATTDWFYDGLLNSSEGLKAFISKSNQLIPNLIGEELTCTLLSILRNRIQDERMGQVNVGIFAFTRLEEAKNRNAFDLPEIFMDIDIPAVESKLKDTLRPTIVKFYKDYDPMELDSILFKYWYLICQRYDEALTSDSEDVGKGVKIPFSNIERLIYL